jgi:hypothetical protein
MFTTYKYQQLGITAYQFIIIIGKYQYLFSVLRSAGYIFYQQ